MPIQREADAKIKEGWVIFTRSQSKPTLRGPKKKHKEVILSGKSTLKTQN